LIIRVAKRGVRSESTSSQGAVMTCETGDSLNKKVIDAMNAHNRVLDGYRGARSASERLKERDDRKRDLVCAENNYNNHIAM
jgi:hypothetical protein